MFDALAVVVEGLRTVAEFDGTVEVSVGFERRYDFPSNCRVSFPGNAGVN